MPSPPDDAASSAPGFQFVNISEPADMKAAGHRKLVRTSVASNHRKKQVLGHSSASRQSTPPHSCSAREDDSRKSYCQACGARLQARRGSSGLSFDADDSIYVFTPGVVDPFRSFPIPSRPYMQVLVDHYLNVYCPTLLPFGRWDGLNSPITTKFFPLAMQNPVYFHAMLCISATHYGFSTGHQTFKEVACHHRAEAIKFLSELLQGGKGSVTDLAIAAAGSLAHHDVIVGDHQALEHHKKGMVTMIRIRGGIDVSNLDWCLKFRAYWIDMMSASYAQTSPSLPIERLSSITCQKNPSIPLSETGFVCLLNICSSTSPMIKGFQELVSLTADVRALSWEIPTAVELYSYTGRRTYAEWGLTTMESSFESEEEAAIKSSCRYSAQIYTNIVLRKMGVDYAVVRHLIKELKKALCLTELGSLWQDKVELLTWVLFQGGAVATEAGMRGWYVSHLVSCFKHLRLQSWNNAVGLLERFIWVSPELQKHGKPLWYEISLGLSGFESSE